MLSMAQRRELSDLMLTRKILGGLTINIEAPLKFVKSVRLSYNLESTSNLFINDNWFYSRVVRLWNSRICRDALDLSLEQFREYLVCVIQNI